MQDGHTQPIRMDKQAQKTDRQAGRTSGQTSPQPTDCAQLTFVFREVQCPDGIPTDAPRLTAGDAGLCTWGGGRGGGGRQRRGGQWPLQQAGPLGSPCQQRRHRAASALSPWTAESPRVPPSPTVVPTTIPPVPAAPRESPGHRWAGGSPDSSSRQVPVAWGVQAFIRKSRRLARSSLVRLWGDAPVRAPPEQALPCASGRELLGVHKARTPALGGINPTLPLALLSFSGPVQSQISQHGPSSSLPGTAPHVQLPAGPAHPQDHPSCHPV